MSCKGVGLFETIFWKLKIVSNVEQCNCDVVNEASELLAVFKTITNKETQRNDIMRKTNRFFEGPQLSLS